jgi:hypothetical protein
MTQMSLCILPLKQVRKLQVAGCKLQVASFSSIDFIVGPNGQQQNLLLAGLWILNELKENTNS